MSSVRRLAALLAWMVGLAGMLVALGALGHGSLAGPDLLRPGSWADWALDRPVAAAAMALVRLVAVAVAWYLLAATGVAVSASVGRSARMTSLSEVVALPFVRGIVQAGLGVGLTGATLAGLAPVAGASPVAPVTHVASARPDAADTTPPVMRRLDAEMLSPSLEPAPSLPAPTQATPPEAPAATPVTATPTTWTVATGDHLWSISSRLLAQTWGRPPTDVEVAPFWRVLIEHNRDRLGDPSNPDLLFPGQVLALPPLPPTP